MNATIVICLLIAGPSAAQTIRVVDGDTFMVGAETIRLQNIDAPEAGQMCRAENGRSYDCGATSTQALARLLEQGGLRCVGNTRDRYDRKLAHCTVQGQDIGAAMVARGHARAYDRYSREYLPQQRLAQKAGVGIWAGDHEAPWQVRERPAQPVPDQRCAIKGNISSKGVRIYHLPGQENYARTRINPRKGERWFCTEAEARQAGWRRARR